MVIRWYQKTIPNEAEFLIILPEIYRTVIYPFSMFHMFHIHLTLKNYFKDTFKIGFPLFSKLYTWKRVKKFFENVILYLINTLE